MTHVLLVGNPNTGKTTLFNALTGHNQQVGNWPGVTVEKKTGRAGNLTLTDLPGMYALAHYEQSLSLDESIALQSLIDMNPDCIINVIDACHLERHLYLTSQLLELNKPVVVVLTMVDIAKQRGISLDLPILSKQLGCPVVAVQAHKMQAVDNLLLLLQTLPQPSTPLELPFSPAVQNLLQTRVKQLLTAGQGQALAYYHSVRKAESESTATEDGEDLDVACAQARYTKVHEIVLACQTKSNDASEHFTAKVDKIVLHPVLALPIFVLMMYLMFWVAINLGGAFQDFFDISTNTLFVQGSAWLLEQCQAPTWLIAGLAYGLGKGLNTVLTFIPVLAFMYFFLSLLESSGYMARAAFVVDKLMRVLGLPGKSFVPMIVGFGCNVPAIMATRTMDSERDRLLTVMMSPFMSCSARLTIYALFVAAFFPRGGQNIVFSLYIIGILMALLTGFILKRTYLKGEASPLIIELPAYHRPSIKRLLKETGRRLRFFLFRAGKLIIPICLILGALNAITTGGEINAGEGDRHSLLSVMGQSVTPLLSPMGISQDNWPASVGLLTGVLAKEVVIGTLNALYLQTPKGIPFDLLAGLGEAGMSVLSNLSELIAHPIALKRVVSSPEIYKEMAKHFDGQAGAYAHLLFILLYIPCLSTMAVIRQETNRLLMWVSVSWSLVLAYAAAVCFYQIATFSLHPEQSLLWVGAMLLMLGLCITGFVLYNQREQGGAHAAANP